MMNQKEYDRCLRCGRKLKNPEARLKGFGPVCEKVERIKKYRLLANGDEWQYRENKWQYRPIENRCQTGGK